MFRLRQVAPLDIKTGELLHLGLPLTIDLVSFPVVLGRAVPSGTQAGTFVALPINVDSPYKGTISRKHCTINKSEGGAEDAPLTITDHGSLNGTYVNQNKIQPPDLPRPLRLGDRIALGAALPAGESSKGHKSMENFIVYELQDPGTDTASATVPSSASDKEEAGGQKKRRRDKAEGNDDDDEIMVVSVAQGKPTGEEESQEVEVISPPPQKVVKYIDQGKGKASASSSAAENGFVVDADELRCQVCCDSPVAAAAQLSCGHIVCFCCVHSHWYHQSIRDASSYGFPAERLCPIDKKPIRSVARSIFCDKMAEKVIEQRKGSMSEEDFACWQGRKADGLKLSAFYETTLGSDPNKLRGKRANIGLQIHVLKSEERKMCTHCHTVITSSQVQANTGKLQSLPLNPYPNSAHGNGPCNALPYHLHLKNCLRAFILARARLRVPIHEFARFTYSIEACSGSFPDAEVEQLKKDVTQQLSETAVELPWWVSGSVELKGPLFNQPIMVAPGVAVAQGPAGGPAPQVHNLGRRGAVVIVTGRLRHNHNHMVGLHPPPPQPQGAPPPPMAALVRGPPQVRGPSTEVLDIASSSSSDDDDEDEEEDDDDEDSDDDEEEDVYEFD